MLKIELCDSVYNLHPHNKVQNATFCVYFFEWCLQYNEFIFIRELDNINRLSELQLAW